MVDITLLGGRSVIDPATERILPVSSRSMALLGFLTSRPGAPQTRSTIAGAFWPDSSERQARPTSAASCTTFVRSSRTMARWRSRPLICAGTTGPATTLTSPCS